MSSSEIQNESTPIGPATSPTLSSAGAPVRRAFAARPVIPGYDVGDELGAGGMGVVWRAYDKGARRHVALKQLPADRPGRVGRDRFVREVETAANLQHPNIARVYHSGLADGLYYYTMELIEGEPLDVYVAKRYAAGGGAPDRVGQRHVLELMSQVCQGVQHAHFKLVIHRDLKPANIVVDTSDGGAVPKVLDFGLAKFVSEHVGEGTGETEPQITRDGNAGGTLAYMAPEQARGEAQVDFRADVYSLGKVLFKLLTGQHAHPLDGTCYEIERRVAEEDVRRPRAVCPQLDRDLEAILLRALDHDPDRRYASAGELGRDIDSYLRGDPVAARRPTAFYVLRRRLAKHRATTAIAVVALAVIACVAVVAQVRITQRIATEQVLKRDIRRQQAMQHVLDQVVRRIDLAAPAAPDESPAAVADALTAEVLKVGGEDSAEFADDLLGHAMAFEELGAILLGNGRFAEAEAMFARGLDARRRVAREVGDGVLAAAPLERYAEACFQQGELGRAWHLARAVYEARTRAFSARSRGTVRAAEILVRVLNAQGRGVDALALGRRTCDAARTAAAPTSADVELLDLNDTLALVLRDLAVRARHDAARADAVHRSADAGEMRARADDYLRQAEAVARENLKDRQTLSPKGIETPEAMHTLASILSLGDRRCWPEAEGHYRRAIELAGRVTLRANRATVSKEHPDMIVWKSNLASTLAAQGMAEGGDAAKLGEAERIYREAADAIDRLRRNSRRVAPDILISYAKVLDHYQNWQAAERYCLKAVDCAAALPPSADPRSEKLSQALVSLGAIQRAQEGWARAAGTYRRLYEVSAGALTADDPESLDAAHLAGYSCARAGDVPAAEWWLRTAYEGRRKRLGADDPKTLESRGFLEEARASLAGKWGG